MSLLVNTESKKQEIADEIQMHITWLVKSKEAEASLAEAEGSLIPNPTVSRSQTVGFGIGTEGEPGTLSNPTVSRSQTEGFDNVPGADATTASGAEDPGDGEGDRHNALPSTDPPPGDDDGDDEPPDEDDDQTEEEYEDEHAGLRRITYSTHTYQRTPKLSLIHI